MSDTKAPEQKTPPQPKPLMALIQNTPQLRIAELDEVKTKFIQNYNFTHAEKMGELMYHKQMIYFKQLIADSQYLQAADRFSLYACFVTCAVHGYSLDPADNEVYVVPIKGKAVLWRQAGAHVKRLQRTNQIKYADQAKLVYEGDEFLVRNGRVVEHIEKYASETIMAGYVRFVLTDAGDDRFFIYRKSDWQAWQKKSTSTKADNPWTSGLLGQPDPGFLRTKLVKHACTEKSWAIGHTPPMTETFTDVEYDELPDDTDEQKPAAKPTAAIYKTDVKPGVSTFLQPENDDDAFTNTNETVPAGVTEDDDDF